MQPSYILILIAVYFCFLILISFLTGKSDSNATFFKANKKSPWYLVAFGMIGASLSGVTFISVPGWVETSAFSYMQMVLGYVVGYLVIGTILLPLYYRLNLTSIYTYLDKRFGNYTYKCGASFFIISRIIGASFRLFLVANVLQLLVFNQLNVPYWVTVSITILLIWVYTYRSGIKTIIITDTLQTFFMLTAVGVSIYLIAQSLGFSIGEVITTIKTSPYSKIFFFDDVKSGQYFWKQFLSGAFIAIVMTGLDQDMMQKNLTCRNLKDAQKNMFWFTIVLVIVNVFFMSLGVLLLFYAQKNGLHVHRDNLFPAIATSGNLGIYAAAFFILGLTASAYSSADSALTSLTTSFSIDILNIEKRYPPKRQIRVRKIIHILFSLVIITTIIIFKYAIHNQSIISSLFKFAGYTYGPLLGFYAFGLFTKYKVKDFGVPFIAVTSVLLTYLLNTYSISLFNFKFGFFILVINGALTFLGLLALRKI